MERMSAEWLAMTQVDQLVLLLYRAATYITLNVMDDAAMLAWVFC